jgi:hypothetical protein
MPHLANLTRPNGRAVRIPSALLFVVIITILATVLSIWYAQRFLPRSSRTHLKISHISLSYDFSPKTPSSILQLSDAFEHRIVAATMGCPSSTISIGKCHGDSETVTIDQHFPDTSISTVQPISGANKPAVTNPLPELSTVGFGLVPLSPKDLLTSGTVFLDFRSGQNRVKIQLHQALPLKPSSFQIRASNLASSLLHKRSHSTDAQPDSAGNVVSMDWLENGELDIELTPGDSAVLRVPTEFGAPAWSGKVTKLTLSEDHLFTVLHVLDPNKLDSALNSINVPRSCMAHAGTELTLNGNLLNVERLGHNNAGTFDVDINGIDALSGVACTPTSAFSSLWFSLLNVFGATAMLTAFYEWLISKLVSPEKG